MDWWRWRRRMHLRRKVIDSKLQIESKTRSGMHETSVKANRWRPKVETQLEVIDGTRLRYHWQH